jgi:hypothetical protein
MTTITDDFMRQMIASAKPYAIVILKKGPNYNRPDVMGIIWEHGRRNFALMEDASLNIVCPVNDGSDLTGIAIFNSTIDETRVIMDDDPGVKEGVFVYEIHETNSFKGDSLQ